MTIESALRAGGASAKDAKIQAPFAALAMREGNINTQARCSMFLAQLMHECGGFYYKEELASGRAYEGRRDLGNTQPGDGVRYKGRGWIQLTGRSNYRAAGKALGLPLESQPQLAMRASVAWRIAVWYWTTRGLNTLADQNNFLAITKRINGGTNGLADRERRYRAIKQHDCTPPSADKFTGYPSDEKKAIRQYDDWNRRNVNLEGRKRLRAEMRLMRKKIWRIAQDKSRGGDGRGWDHLNRRKRYDSLLARSK